MPKTKVEKNRKKYIDVERRIARRSQIKNIIEKVDQKMNKNKRQK